VLRRRGGGGLDGNPGRTTSVVGSFALEDVGKAAGANSMMRELGGVVGVAVAAAVLAAPAASPRPTPSLDAFAPAISVVAAVSLAGAVVTLALPGRRQAAETAPAGAVSGSRDGGANLSSER
jgi:hypothetical protein